MFILPAFTPTSTTYTITSSLRFNSADTAYLNRTPGAAGNRQKNTHSFWVKLGKLGTFKRIFIAYGANTDNDATEIAFGSNDCLYVLGWTTVWRVSTRVFRDPSAWYHIVVAIDTTQATANNRIRVYVNGVEETSFSTLVNPSQNANLGFTAAALHRIGIPGYASSEYFDGYLAEVHFIDGTQCTPSDFGQTDSTTGQWVPKQVTGLTYGTTGYYLPFSDNSGTTSTTLGNDANGSNDWTPNNFSVTAGTGNDSLTDTPTNNYATIATNMTYTNAAVSDGALKVTGSANYSTVFAPFGMSSGKWYWEYVVSAYSASGDTHIGLGTAAHGTYINTWAGNTAAGWIYAASSGQKFTSGSGSAYGSAYTTNDIIGVAFDADNGKLYFSKNGTWQNSGDPVAGTGGAYTGLTSGPYFPLVTAGTSNNGYLNFGQHTFNTTPPTGFSALCTQNLPTPAIVKPSSYFDIDTYTGTGATRSKTGVGFQPDLVWFKGRSGATDHALYDAVRGVQKRLESNTADAEVTGDSTGLTAFNSDGYTTGALAQLNTNAATYAAWMWKEGVTSGFDVANGVSTGTSGTLSVPHSLGVTPAFVLVKNRNISDNWWVFHKSLSSLTDSYLFLNTTAAVATSAGIWGHTSSNLVIKQGAIFSASSQNAICYAFAEVAGFSRFGSYTGNASADGPFVHCGFKPKFVLIKCSSTTGSWWLFDTARDTYNVASARLVGEATTTEASSATLDFLSNGFKLRTVTTDPNAAQTYVFAAFAEAPAKYATAR